MKKNGFTLVELLAVIVILSVIAILVTPVILGIISQSRSDVSDIQSEAIERAARHYVDANAYSLDGTCKTESGCTITIAELKDGGYLEEKQINNAKEDKNISDDEKVQIKREGGRFIYTFPAP